MEVILIISVIFILGLIFGSDGEKQSKLPSFTKEESEHYYYKHLRGKKR